jgi:1-piperideine-2-carboxylate/1-pyrroline-2-carboxylate reductase [NAD(P)H]
VVAYDASTGVSLFALDGPTVTGRRSAAVTLLVIERLRESPPRCVAVIGTGTQASTHVHALSFIHPRLRLVVLGISRQEEEKFCSKHPFCAIKPFTDRNWAEVDVVITLTTSKTPVYLEEAVPDRLVVGVGAFTSDAAEVGRETVLASTVIVDEAHATVSFRPASIGRALGAVLAARQSRPVRCSGTCRVPVGSRVPEPRGGADGS